MDIPDLVQHFLKKYNRLFKKNIAKVTDSAMKILTQYSWPGNIREIENVVERLVAVSDDDVISQEDVPVEYYLPGLSKAEIAENGKNLLQVACDAFERNFILKALEREKWNRKRTAQALGIPLSTLKFKFNKLQIYEILSERSLKRNRRPNRKRPTNSPKEANMLS